MPLHPLSGLRVVELAGLAPGPFCGMLLSDYGASVLRVDGPQSPKGDVLARHKSSINLNLKNPKSRNLFLSLISRADVLIDPYRPGVLERLDLSPEKRLLELNPRLIIARLSGYRREGEYRDRAGHDINYLAVSGVLSLLGRAGEKPYPPANLLGDFAGGGAMCALGILMALLSRHTTGKGQVVEANMVDGAAYLATMPRLTRETPFWGGPRGENFLDGGCPWYTVYETKQPGEFVAVGALEPKFYQMLLKGLEIDERNLPSRDERASWPALEKTFRERFASKSRKEWEAVFDGVDACVTPVLSHAELQQRGHEQKLPIRLHGSPGREVLPENGGWTGGSLAKGSGGEELLRMWMGWSKGVHYTEREDGVLEQTPRAKL